jgi:zinc protease
MVEHMVFHESRDVPEGIARRMAAMGWRPGVQYNAVTNYERTLYMLNLSGKAQLAQWDQGLFLLSQIAGHALIRDTSLAQERRVVLEEWRGKLGARERMEQQRRLLLRDGGLQPLRPTIGTERSIRTQPVANLQRFYQRWYQPNNMALLVVGDIDVATAEARIRHWFAARPAAALPPHAERNPVLGNTLRTGRLQDADNRSSQVGWVLRSRSSLAQDSAGFRTRLLDNLAEKLLKQELARYQPLRPDGVRSVVARKGFIGGTTFTLGFAATVDPSAHQAGMQHLLLLQRLLQEQAPDNAKLTALREDLLALARRTPRSNAGWDAQKWLQELQNAVADERVLQDPAQKGPMAEAILAGISNEDIIAHLRGWLHSPDRLLFMMAPGLKPLPLPTPQQVRALQADIAAKPLPVLPATAAPAPIALPDLPPALPPASSTLLWRDAAQQVAMWQLANGDRLVWQYRANQNGKLRYAAESGAGYRLPGADGWQWQLAAQLAAASGPAGWQAKQLRAWEQAQRLGLSQSQSSQMLTQQATIAPDQLATLWHYYQARQLHASIDPALLRLQQDSLGRDSSAASQAYAALDKLRYAQTAADQAPSVAALRQQTPAGLLALWQQLAARPVTHYLSGAASEAEVVAAANLYLAAIPRQPAAPVAQALLPLPGRFESRHAIAREPAARVQAYGSVPMPWQGERALQVATLGRALHAALRQSLREEAAGVYSVQFSLKLNPDTDRLESEWQFTTDPARLHELLARVDAILARPAAALDDAALLPALAYGQQQADARLNDDDSRFNRLQLSVRHYGDTRYLAHSASLGSTLDAASVRALAAGLRLDQNLALLLTLPDPKLMETQP